VRAAIEGFAAEEAARSRTAADLVAMRSFEQAFLAEAGSSEPRTGHAIRANQALHFAVYRATGLPTLVGVVEGLWLKIGPVLNLDLRVSPERLRTGGAVEHHRRLLVAIEAGDSVGARNALVNDIIYIPRETPLIAAARRRGNRTVTGLGMLLHQGIPAWKAWFGIEPKVTAELRTRIEATL
jgi:DNA-binding GntR family transcriptional regulator